VGPSTLESLGKKIGENLNWPQRKGNEPVVIQKEQKNCSQSAFRKNPEKPSGEKNSSEVKGQQSKQVTGTSQNKRKDRFTPRCGQDITAGETYEEGSRIKPGNCYEGNESAPTNAGTWKVDRQAGGPHAK